MKILLYTMILILFMMMDLIIILNLTSKKDSMIGKKKSFRMWIWSKKFSPTSILSTFFSYCYHFFNFRCSNFSFITFNYNFKIFKNIYKFSFIIMFFILVLLIGLFHELNKEALNWTN